MPQSSTTADVISQSYYKCATDLGDEGDEIFEELLVRMCSLNRDIT